MRPGQVLQLCAVPLSFLQVELQTQIFSLQSVYLLLRAMSLKHTHTLHLPDSSVVRLHMFMTAGGKNEVRVENLRYL